MKTARLLVLVLLASLPVLARAAQGQTTTVRGRVDRLGVDRHPHPAVYATVTLRNVNTGQRTSPSYTGRDGMYYVYKVTPGGYFLEIRVFTTGPLYTFRITAQARPYTDLAPVVVP